MEHRRSPLAAAAGSKTLTFDEFALGTAITNNYKSSGVLFSSEAGNPPPFLTNDGSNPTSPVLSGYPQFAGNIIMRFVVPGTTTPTLVGKVSLDVGYINNPGSVEVVAFSTKGIEVLPVETEGISTITTTVGGISSVAVIQSDTEEAGFAVDNVSFTPGKTAAVGLAGGAPVASESNGQGNPAEPRFDCCISFGGDPVNTLTGNFTETITDVRVAGTGPGLGLSRTYNSQAAAAAGPFGHGWTSTWETSLAGGGPAIGARARIRFGNGSTTTFTRTGLGWAAAPRVTAVLTDEGDGTHQLALHGGMRYTFSAAGRLISMTDRAGRSTSLTYTADTITATDQAGRSVLLSLTGGHVSSVTDPAGHIVRYGYNAAGDLVKVTDEVGRRTTFRYSSAHRMTSLVCPSGRRTDNRYDSHGRVVTQIAPGGGVTRFAYVKAGKRRVTDAGGRRTDQTYVGSLLTTQVVGAGTKLAQTTRYAYDPQSAGRVKEQLPGKVTVTRTYDADGNVLSVTDSLHRTMAYTYDEQGDPTSLRYPSGRVDTVDYDAAGNPVLQTVDATGLALTSSFAYDGEGNVTEAYTPRGAHSSYGYDAAGNLTQLTDPDGARTSYVHDALGNVIRQTQEADPGQPGAPGSRVTRYTYDRASQVARVTAPDGGASAFAYDVDGQRTKTITPGGYTTRTHYDAAGRADKTTGPDGSVTRTTYDKIGQVRKVSLANRSTTSYGYDLLGRQTSVTDPRGRTTKVAYTAANQVKTRRSPSGTRVSYRYDKSGAVLVQNFSDATPDATYAYTVDGRRAQQKDGAGTSTYRYDTADRLIGVTAGSGRAVGYELDADGNATTTSYPNGESIRSAFSPAARLTSTTDWLGHTTQFDQDAFGDTDSVTYGNGIVGDWIRDPAGRTTGVSYAAGAGPIATFTATLAADRSGLATELTATGATTQDQQLSYSTRAQLSKVNGEKVGYDVAGNLLRRPDGAKQTVDASGAVTKATARSTTTYSYSKDGARKSRGGSAKRVYSYDAALRLTKVATSSGKTVARYGYDGDGLRRSKVTGGQRLSFSYDQHGDLPLLLDDGHTSYVYGPSGTPIEQIADGHAVYLLLDAVGNVRVRSDQDGAVVGTTSYGVTGKVESTTGVRSALGFSGQYTDSETGFAYLRARYYDPATASFLTPDPLVALSGSGYGYAGGNPVGFSDPTGLFYVSCEQLKNDAEWLERGAGDLVYGTSEGLTKWASTLGRLLRSSDDPAVRSFAARLLRGAGTTAQDFASNPAVRILGRVAKPLPFVSGALTTVNDIAEGKGYGESVGAGVGATAGSLGGAAAGTALGTAGCAALAGATFGGGSVACPLLIVGGGAVGSLVGGWVGEKVGGWVGGLFD